MNKKILTAAALLFAGTAFANAATLSLSDLTPSSGAVIGSKSNTASVSDSAFPTTDTYSDWSTLLGTSDTWYVQKGYNWDVSGTDYAPQSNSVILAAGGPSGKGSSACGAIRFSIGQEYFADVSNAIVFSFDVVLTTTGNNNKQHTFDFELLSSDLSVNAKNSSTYVSKDATGEQIALSSTLPQTVSLTLSADDVAAIASSSSDAEFVFSITTNDISVSNKGIIMSNFRLDGVAAVPEPSAFGLLAGAGALALVAARRRRKSA